LVPVGGRVLAGTMAGSSAVVHVLVSCTLAVAVVLALVGAGLRSGTHVELLASKHGKGAAAPAKGDGVSAQTIKRIMLKMNKKVIHPLSKTRKLKEALAAEQLKLANLKVTLSSTAQGEACTPPSRAAPASRARTHTCACFQLAFRVVYRLVFLYAHVLVGSVGCAPSLVCR